MEDIYLPMEANTKTINQFRWIFLLKLEGNMFTGIFSKRSVAYQQNNEYVHDTVHKAGIRGSIER